MLEWLQSTTTASPIGPGVMAMRLVLAVLLGGVVALIYRFSHGRDAREARTLATTLVLLTGLLAMVSMVIGDSVARAFGLVGALSIIRFRTVVEDTRDTAFVIFAVIVGMAVGTGLLLVAVLGILIIGDAALALSRPGRTALGAPQRGGSAHVLRVRLGLGHDPDALVGPVLARHTLSRRLVSLATIRQGSAIDASYAVTLPAPGGAGALVADLNAVGGVQSVELEQA